MSVQMQPVNAPPRNGMCAMESISAHGGVKSLHCSHR